MFQFFQLHYAISILSKLEMIKFFYEEDTCCITDGVVLSML